MNDWWEMWVVGEGGVGGWCGREEREKVRLELVVGEEYKGHYNT